MGRFENKVAFTAPVKKCPAWPVPYDGPIICLSWVTGFLLGNQGAEPTERNTVNGKSTYYLTPWPFLVSQSFLGREGRCVELAIGGILVGWLGPAVVAES